MVLWKDDININEKQRQSRRLLIVDLTDPLAQTVIIKKRKNWLIPDRLMCFKTSIDSVKSYNINILSDDIIFIVCLFIIYHSIKSFKMFCVQFLGLMTYKDILQVIHLSWTYNVTMYKCWIGILIKFVLGGIGQ
jgi:hypothetical protein